MMLILGPLTAPRISAVIVNFASSSTALTMLEPSTTSTGAKFTTSPTSALILSTVSSSPTLTFSCLPPARTIAYTAKPFVVSSQPPVGDLPPAGAEGGTPGKVSTGALCVELHLTGGGGVPNPPGLRAQVAERAEH